MSASKGHADTMWSCSPWALLPLFCSGFTAAGLWLVYFITAFQVFGGVTFDLPYIGFVASFPPASCIFSAVMNVSAFLFLTVTVLRYHQLKPRVDMRCLNIISLMLFIGACVGMLITGNVPFNVYAVVADGGSYMTFGLGLLYCWIQSFITLRVNSKKVGIVRFLLSASITLCLILYIYLMFKDVHARAAQCQWSLVMLLLVFFSTFAVEFRNYRFSVECTENAGPVFTKVFFLPEVSKPVTLKAP